MSEVSLFDGRWWEKNPPPPPAASADSLTTRGDPFLSLPAPPLADPDLLWNLEARKLASPDLADSNWIVQQFESPYTLLTRLGEIQSWSITSLPAFQYRSSIVDGVLLCQFPGQIEAVQIYKPTDAHPNGRPVSHSYKSRLYNSVNRYDLSDMNLTFVSDWPNNREAGQFYYCGMERARWIECFHAAPSTYGVLPGAGQDVPWYLTDTMRTINYLADVGSNILPHYLGSWAQLPNGQRCQFPPFTGGYRGGWSTDIDVRYAGVIVSCSIRELVAIDFIRRTTLDANP